MMSNIEIRPANAQDAGALSLLAQATYLETYFDVLPRGDMLIATQEGHSLAEYERRLADPDWRVWVAERAGTGNLVGYVSLCSPDLPVPTGPDDLEVRRLYVLSPFKGAGLGARLMSTAVEAARAAGARRVLLGVFAENHAAQAFYARQGYVPAGVSTFWVGATAYDDRVMALTL